MEPAVPKDVTVPTHGVPSHLEQHEDADESSATVKRLLVQDQIDYAELTADLTPDPKKRKLSFDQQQKRQKYDVLNSFIKVFIVEDKDGMVEKDAIFNLYVRKVPQDHLIARNALYRRIWGSFKDKNISTYQHQYRENLKGLRLRRIGEPLPTELDKDFELLRNVGVKEPILEYAEHELQDVPLASPVALPKTVAASTLTALEKLTNGRILAEQNSPNFAAVAIDALEAQAKLLVAGIAELRAKLSVQKPDS